MRSEPAGSSATLRTTGEGVSASDRSQPTRGLDTVLVAKDLVKTYQMGDVAIHALRGANLSLSEGEFVVLLGASGSGKSTLLNILGGLDVPTSGTIRYRDHDLSAASDRDLTRYRREHVGFVFQFYNLIPSLTARENVALVTDLAAEPYAPEDVLALVGLSDRLDHFPAQLSGGEQQRVAIARAVAKRPDLLLCDEPTGALDFSTGRLVLATIELIARELGTTTVIITHNAPVAAIADRVLTLDHRCLGDERDDAHRAVARAWSVPELRPQTPPGDLTRKEASFGATRVRPSSRKRLRLSGLSSVRKHSRGSHVLPGREDDTFDACSSFVRNVRDASTRERFRAAAVASHCRRGRRVGVHAQLRRRQGSHRDLVQGGPARRCGRRSLPVSLRDWRARRAVNRRLAGRRRWRHFLHSDL